MHRDIDTQPTVLPEPSLSKAFSQRDALAIHSNADVQEQNKMLADSAEGARREVPQLMQVRRSVHAEDEDGGGDEDDSSQVGLVGLMDLVIRWN